MTFSPSPGPSDFSSVPENLSEASAAKTHAAETAETLNFLRDRAADLGTELPPLGPTPRKWPAPLRALRGEPIELASKPWPLLKGVLKHSRWSIVFHSILLSVNAVSSALLSLAVGMAINAAVAHGLSAELWKWVGIFLGLTALMSATDGLNQIVEIVNWMRGAMDTARAVAHRVARAGRAAKRDQPAGDIVTAILSDSNELGAMVVFVSEVISALVSFAVVTWVLLSISVPLGLMVVVGFPLAVLGVSLLVKPLQAKQAVQREEQGKLTTISADAVSGLRVLRGIGGEDYYNVRYKQQSTRVRDAGISFAGNQAALGVLRSSVPQLFMALAVGFGALMTFEGNMNAGDLFTFAGMTAYLSRPIGTATWAAQIGTRAWVGAKKLSGFYALEPVVGDGQVDPEETVTPETLGTLPLTDCQTGVSVEPGLLTALVAQSPDISAAVAKRMARVDDADESKSGDTDLRTIPLETVRQGILLSEADAQLFRGTLHSELRAARAAEPPSRGVTELVYREHLEEVARKEGMLFRADRVPDDPRLMESMRVADAQDALDSLSGGMAGWLAERGRNLSGGQRQRVALARAIYANAPVLIAVEPTSAVDSHTEERIASRIREERSGSTTVVVTASPLWLEKCDQIVVLDDEGNEVTRGSHTDLREAAGRGEPGALLYRSIVQREAGEIDETTSR